MYTCEIEENVYRPVDYNPDRLTLRERAAAACKTASMLGVGDSWAEEETPLSEDQKVQVLSTKNPPAKDQRQMMTGPETATYINSLLSTHDMMVVQSAAQLRTYITNKLIIESDNYDPKVRIQALKMLGQITDVGLFTEKSEVTVNNKATSELQGILREKLTRLANKMDPAVDVTDVIEVKKPAK